MIIVIGSINLDLIARVKKLPSPGQTVSGSSFETAPGGKGANQALAASRAGAEVSMVGAIGADANAQEALKLLGDAGVNLDGISEIENQPTGVALILVDETSGENQIAVVPGANGVLAPDILNGLEITRNDLIVLQMEVPADVNAEAIKRASQAGAKSIINIAPFSDAAANVAAQADITIANETEFDALAKALDLAGNDCRSRVEDYFSKTEKSVVVTLGPQGAVGIDADGVVEVSAPEIEAVDTVGAGDTFCGAFAVALCEGISLGAAMRFACTAGAIACLKQGAQPAIPTRKQIDDFMN